MDVRTHALCDNMPLVCQLILLFELRKNVFIYIKVRCLQFDNALQSCRINANGHLVIVCGKCRLYNALDATLITQSFQQGNDRSDLSIKYWSPDPLNKILVARPSQYIKILLAQPSHYEILVTQPYRGENASQALS